MKSNDNELQSMFEKGQSKRALSFASSLGSVLNYFMRNMTNSGNNNTFEVQQHKITSSQVKVFI